MKCKHNAGWYVEEASLHATSDGGELTILPHGRNTRRDKVRAVCNCGCGATRNIYLTGIEFSFGKIRKPEGKDGPR